MKPMNDNSRRQLPYQTLGARLRDLRLNSRESLAEVSGAVEIDIRVLEGYEQGQARPSEDILFLLISHFDIHGEEATKLWRMAGYEQQDLILEGDNNSTVIMLPANIKIEYTDMVHVQANEFGVVVSFMQSAGPAGQPMIVSRLGMSREHAQNVLETLQQTLGQSEPISKSPKSLPEPKRGTKHKDRGQ
jgi:transcriptional regulator with XRE-family HTH domain